MVRRNDGLGNFTGNQAITQPIPGYQMALGDLDGDGDLLALGSASSLTWACPRFNDGQGSFSGSQFASVGATPVGLALGDVDADGDLDLLVASCGTSGGTSTTVSVKLNGSTALAAVPGRLAGLTLLPNPTPGVALLAGADAGGPRLWS